MKCLLVLPLWSESRSVDPASGRPHLDLLLHCLGYTELVVRELEPDSPFDPGDVDESFGLILIQADCRNTYGRLRRSVLSNLGLSLGLDGQASDRLRVVGARPLYDPSGIPSGFVIRRRGRIVAFFERPLWNLRMELIHVIRTLLHEEENFRRPRFDICWLVETHGQSLNLPLGTGDEDVSQYQVRPLPDGDSAIMMSSVIAEEFRNRFRAQLGTRLYALSPRPLEEICGQMLKETKLTVAVAESCTAGLVATRLSAVPGSSEYLMAGFITYSNQAKNRHLDVADVLIERCGAVSPEVALSMARNALRAANTDLAVAVTGIAGPGGGTADKPVGTVHLAAVSLKGITLEHKANFNGSRDQIRFQASQTALHLLRRLTLEHRYPGSTQGKNNL
ncbi:MAG: CinA family protein [Magnetococcales bacterium]|nr:CinA family protein [Magnetococcales bacterium]MBF0152025.1 CinA family protein [Magnetococcales bacterium]MBF0174988.1 CinA family protein [Magnetococcales bacterium]MBF0349088.1 CinA family protein [Magnetococcales bacterium]